MNDQHTPVKEKEKISIHIDNKQFFAPSELMTGAQLKALANIGPDLDLWKEEHGHGDDLLIADTDTIQIKSGDHFFTSPKSLNPGSK